MRFAPFLARFVLLFGLCLLGPFSASAEPVPGQDDPGFTAALERWLKDDDQTSLRELARLALAGNPAARLLLGMIEKDASQQGPWLALRTKSERRALLRTKGGFSGRSWLRLVQGQDFVDQMLAVLDSRTSIERILEFADMGEHRATRFGLITLEARQWVGFANWADDPRFPVGLRYLIWREWQKSGNRAAALTQALAGLHPGDGQRILLRNPVAVRDLQAWLLRAEIGLPLQQLCRRNCPGVEAACLHAGFQAVGGYRRFATLGTPMAGLISEADYAASLRGQASVLRRALSFAHMTESRLRPIARISACFAELLAAEGQRF